MGKRMHKHLAVAMALTMGGLQMFPAFAKQPYATETPVLKQSESAMDETQRTALEQAIVDANALDETKYTADSWKKLDDVLRAGELLDVKEGEEADAAKAAIDEAVSKLEEVYPNLALNRPVTVSGLEVNDGRFTADKAVDGIVSATSRVSFAKDKDEQWLQVDLGEVKDISCFVLNYESQCPSYEILVSENGTDFTKVYEASGIKGQVAGIQRVNIESTKARYVKYVQKQRWQHSGNKNFYSGSLYEFEVYEQDPETLHTSDNLALKQNVTVSGLEVNDGRFTADKAVDGEVSKESRVSFAKDKDEQWMLIDLGMRRTVSHFVVNYESQCPSWELQLSTDGEHYTTVHTASGIKGQVEGIQKVTIDAQKARYIKYVQKERWTHSGNGKQYSGSIYEFEAYRERPVSATADGVLEALDGAAPTIENGKLVLPEVPAGFAISLYGCDNRQVVAMDGTISQPLEDMEVNVLYKITNNDDPEDVAKSDKDITFTVPGKYTAEQSLSERPKVLPGIREWKGNEGQFVLGTASRIVYSDESLAKTAAQISGYIKEMTGRDIECAKDDPIGGDIVLTLDGSLENLGYEGYTMHISEKLEIKSSDAKGLLYGGISVTQMLTNAADHASINKGLVRDYPKYEVRSGMLDVARTYVPLEYLTEMTKYMAYFKLNEVQVHVNDYWGATGYSAFRLESETYPEITAKDGSYSKDDYRQYQIDMKEYGIDVITEIDTPYHSECFRPIEGAVMLSTGALDIRAQSSYDIIENVFDEYLDGPNPVIQSEYFHIGTDEYNKSYSEEMRAWTDHFINYVNNKGYKTRMWGSIGKKGFNGTTPVSKDATVNLWAPYWTDVHEIFDAGYPIINTVGGWLYIVPGGNAGYTDRMNLGNLWDRFDVCDFEPDRGKGDGTAIMPKAHPQTIGAEFAVWNDMTSFKGGFTWFDIYDRFKDAVALVSEKTWYGSKTEGQTKEEFLDRVSSVNNRVPYANPGRYVDTIGEITADYDFSTLKEGTVADLSENGYDAIVTGGKVVDGKTPALDFNNDGYISLPFDTMGYPYTVSFKVKLDEITENTELFSGHDGRLVANVNGTGKLGFERCGYKFAFDYEIPEGQWVTIALAGDRKNTNLYVNGEKIGIAVNQAPSINNRKDSNSFFLPAEKIMNNADGSIATLKLYNRVLTDAEIADIADVEVRENLALNKTATASSVYPDRPWTADKAVDGIDLDANSRWSSKRATGTTNDDDTDKGTKEQWWMVDLGDTYALDTIKLSWEPAFATVYDVQVSMDGETFETVKSVTNGNGGQVAHLVDVPEARYVRILCKEPKTAAYGYSLYEVTVYGEKTAAPDIDAGKMLLDFITRSVKDADLSLYKPEGQDEFKAAIAEAEDLLANSDDQTLINASVVRVHDAWCSLRFIPDEARLAEVKDKLGI